ADRVRTAARTPPPPSPAHASGPLRRLRVSPPDSSLVTDPASKKIPDPLFSPRWPSKPSRGSSCPKVENDPAAPKTSPRDPAPHIREAWAESESVPGDPRAPHALRR